MSDVRPEAGWLAANLELRQANDRLTKELDEASERGETASRQYYEMMRERDEALARADAQRNEIQRLRSFVPCELWDDITYDQERSDG